MTEKRTVMQVFEATADKYGDQIALRVKRSGKWKETSWSQYRDEVRTAAKALIHLGVEPGKGVSIIGFNSPQWQVADLAAIYVGARPAGIYTTNSAEQCKYVASHSESQIAVVENNEQLAKFLEIRDELDLKAIIMMYGDSGEEGVYAWPEFLKLADEVSDEDLEKRIEAQKPDDVCTYIYTSGTTGDPKAVMISHDNITWTAKAALEALGAQDGDHMLSYLPLSHIAEQIVSLHGPMVAGATVSFAESIEKLADNMREVHPTIFLGVPRVWEKIQAKIQEASAANPSGLQKKIAAWARKQGLKGGYADQTGEARPLFWGVAEKLVFNKVRDRLGLDRCRIAVTSAAPISKDTLEFFLSLGLPLMEVYGMSECTGPATTSLPTAYKTTYVGRVLPGAEIKIAEDGEICMKGRHVFKGYFKNQEATDEALDEDGWLHSGDIGEIDKDGFLKITDRKKDLLITAGGENIAPQVIEGKLKGIPWVSQAVVVGDRQKHLSALLTIDETKFEDALSQAGSSAKSMKDAADDDKLHAFMMKEVEKVNADLARVQTIKKIKILPSELTIEGGELTPTMKVKRKIVNQKYQEFIDEFYGG